MQLAHQELFVSWINVARDRAKQQQLQLASTVMTLACWFLLSGSRDCWLAGL